jgi:2-hydroxy-6-oxonona-2,4-dienedioate hydrolase
MIQYPVAVNGVTTRVLEGRPRSAPGSRPSVVLLHGLGARADRFWKNIDVLAAEGYRVVAFDFPGHGLAQKGELPYSVPFYAAYLEGLLAELPARDVILIGTSLGGHVASYAVAHHPGLAAGLVLVGAVGIVPLGEQARQLISASVLDTTRDGIAAKLERVFHDPAMVTEDLIDEEHLINTSPGAAVAGKALAEYFRTRLDEDVVGPLLAHQAASTPTLLVWGSQDKTVPLSVGQQCQAVLGMPPLSVIEEAGHAPYLEQAPAFNQAVLEFMSTSTGAKR